MCICLCAYECVCVWLWAFLYEWNLWTCSFDMLIGVFISAQNYPTDSQWSAASPTLDANLYWNNNECMKKNNTKRLNMKTITNIFIHKFTHTHTHTHKTLTQTLTRTRNTHATQTRQWRTISYALENPTPEKWPYLFIIPEPTLIFNRFTWFLLCESFNILTLYSVSFKRFE